MDEVRRIKVLSNLIQQGHQIGQLAHINTNELESLWSSLYSNGVTLPINNSISKQTKVLKIKSQDNSINLTLDQLSFYNIREMMNTIHQARLQSDARSFLLEFTAPLLGRLNFLCLYACTLYNEHFFALNNHTPEPGDQTLTLAKGS